MYKLDRYLKFKHVGSIRQLKIINSDETSKL
jgi:hypothetical protein